MRDNLQQFVAHVRCECAALIPTAADPLKRHLLGELRRAATLLERHDRATPSGPESDGDEGWKAEPDPDFDPSAPIPFALAQQMAEADGPTPAPNGGPDERRLLDMVARRVARRTAASVGEAREALREALPAGTSILDLLPGQLAALIRFVIALFTADLGR